MPEGMRALDRVTQVRKEVSWQVAHAALSRLARERAAADAEEGRWLLAAQRSAAHVHLGFGAFSEYIKRLFGYKPRSLQEKLRVAEALDDDSALLELARCALGGPRDEGRASYQVVLGVCPECSSARQHAAGGLVPVGPELIRMAHCDARHLGFLAEPSPPPANDLQPHETSAEQQGDGASEDEAARVGAGATESQAPCVSQAASITSGAAAEQGTPGCTSPTNDHPSPSNLRVRPRATPTVRVRPRATQTIPPALRRTVLLRDQHHCQVPVARTGPGWTCIIWSLAPKGDATSWTTSCASAPRITALPIEARSFSLGVPMVRCASAMRTAPNTVASVAPEGHRALRRR